MNENKGYDFLNDGNFDISSYDRQDLNEFEKAKLKRDIHSRSCDDDLGWPIPGSKCKGLY